MTNQQLIDYPQTPNCYKESTTTTLLPVGPPQTPPLTLKCPQAPTQPPVGPPQTPPLALNCPWALHGLYQTTLALSPPKLSPPQTSPITH